MSLKDKKIIVGLTGGIAAYKIPNLIRLLKKGGAEVHCIMTESSTKFITSLTIETVSQNPVALEIFPKDRFVGTHHIDMAEWPDLFLIAPATANIIAKVAGGICDDLLSTVICATQKPIMFAPAMNNNMYLNPITQRNIEYLKSLGYIFINPEHGELACETVGWGRMAEPEDIFDQIQTFFQKKKSLKNKRVIVTAGPCREAIDPVRYISNRSSGRMGYALASASEEAGARVTLISGPTNIKPPAGIEFIRVETTEEMYKAVKSKFDKTDILIMAAAPADFKAAHIKSDKIKKGNGPLALELSPTIDILSSLKDKKKKEQIIVGFALETKNGTANAKEKLKSKGLDLIILNSMKDGVPFDSDQNKVTLYYKNGKSDPSKRMPKMELARLIVEKIAGIRKK
jgi:phosphopantothenoylcysteine decarboxylase/phosphopantothenate--cysteine ligase